MYEYIYALTIDGEKIYIGRTNDTARRYLEHLRDNSGSPKSEAIKIAKQKGKNIKLEIIATVECGSLGSMEDDEIQKVVDSGGKLLNQIGGNRNDRLTAAQRHQLNKDIQYFKATRKPKKGDVGEGWTPERQKEVNANYEAYKRGELTLEDLKKISESRTRVE